jgi:hypothetical protein
VPRRSFIRDFLWVAVLGFLVFGVGFSWLGTRNSLETFGENFRTVGVWSGLMFGVGLGVALAWSLRPVERAHPIDSPDAFRGRLRQVLLSVSGPGRRRVPYALRQEAGEEILLHSTSAKLGNRTQEETFLLRLTGDSVTGIGTRMAHSWLRKKVGVDGPRP